MLDKGQMIYCIEETVIQPLQPRVLQFKLDNTESDQFQHSKIPRLNKSGIYTSAGIEPITQISYTQLLRHCHFSGRGRISNA